MTNPHDVTADLPPPRDDEPASLRQDIVDELTDHLQTALHREMLTGRSSGPCETASDPQDSSLRTAQHRALTRFGNPAAIARQLWLDAMKERLMVQKLTLLLATVATAAVVFLSIVLWQTLQRAGEAQRLANEAQLALAQQSEQMSASILQALESLRTPPVQESAVDGWSPLTVKLVSEEGDPVQGTVKVTGLNFTGNQMPINVARSAGPSGIAECGMLPYGNYTMTVTATAAEERHTQNFMVAPGQPNKRTIVCPTSPPPEVEIRFALNPPENLKSADLRYIASLTPRPRQIGSGEWRPLELGSLSLWVDASGRILKQIGGQGSSNGRPDSPPPGVVGLTFKPARRLREYIYDVGRGSVALTIPFHTRSTAWQNIEEWAVVSNNGFSPRSEENGFEPRTGEENVWEFDIPEDIWAAVFNDFRKAPESRHITIPDGWATVTITESMIGGGVPASVNEFIDVGVLELENVPLGQIEASKLIDSVQCIAIDSVAPTASAGLGDQDTSGVSRQQSAYVLMVTSEQKAVIEELKTLSNVRFVISAAKNELETPVLHEDVLEEIRQAVAPDDS